MINHLNIPRVQQLGFENISAVCESEKQETELCFSDVNIKKKIILNCKHWGREEQKVRAKHVNVSSPGDMKSDSFGQQQDLAFLCFPAQRTLTPHSY